MDMGATIKQIIEIQQARKQVREALAREKNLYRIKHLSPFLQSLVDPELVKQAQGTTLQGAL